VLNVGAAAFPEALATKSLGMSKAANATVNTMNNVEVQRAPSSRRLVVTMVELLYS